MGSPTWRRVIAVVLTIVACITLISLLKIPGLFISLLLAAAVWLMASARPEATEETALRTSIKLSAEDIREVMAQFAEFETSPEPEKVADRTIHRPALLDLDVKDPEIERFHHQYAAAARFLKRLPARLANPILTTSQLESLLSSTDQRALDLQEAWLAARRAAQQLGADYHQADNQA